MHSSRKALLALVLIAPVLTEVGTGNTPLLVYLDPRVFLFLALAYSLPVVVIREVAVRRRLSVPGIFLLGLAYGLWNEGLLAQTLIRAQHVPIDRFDHYLFAGGFNWAWACLIVPWHALFAVLFPIALVHHRWPDSAAEPWLGRRTFAALASLVAAAAIFISVVRTPHPQMSACLAGIVLLALLGLGRCGSAQEEPVEAKRVLPLFTFGAVSYLAIFLTLVIEAGRVPGAVYLASATLLFSAFAWLSGRRGLLRPPKVADVALGGYFAVAAFHALAGLGKHSVVETVVGLVLCLILATMALADSHSQKRIAEVPTASLS